VGWSPQVLRATEVIISGPADFLLVYNGTPGPGTLLYSISPVSGVDPYGNAYQAGATSYQGTTSYTQIFGSQVTFFSSVAPGFTGFQVSDTDVLEVVGTPGVASFQVTVPISQPLYASDPVAGFGTAETWHPITLDAGWSAHAGYAAPSYRLDTDGALWLTGMADFGSSQTVNHNLNNGHPLPAPYRPLTQKVFRSTDTNTQRAGVQISTGGVIEALGSAAWPYQFCEIDVKLPLNL